jgi:ABC-type sugar transport system ATPase subunit
MAIRPRLFLFDEPLSALDAVMREMLREEMRLQLRSVAATSLYVTHDRQEAMMLADTIAIIENGAIRQSGPAAELFAHPADAWVAEFLGLQVLCPHPPASGPEASGNGLLKLRVGGGALEVASHGTPIPASARLAFRPEDVHLEGLHGAGLNGAVGIPAAVEAVVATGPLYRIDLSSSAGNNGTPKHGARFHALVLRTELRRLGLRAGDRVLATLRPDDVILVPERRKPDRPD